MSDAAIEIDGLVKQWQRFTLGPLSLAIPRGVIFGLVGSNGAGKTTTLDLVAGIGRADAGSIRVLGMDVTRQEVAVKRRLAYAGPETNYAVWRRVGRAIDFVSGFYADWDPVRCTALMAAFGLDRSQAIGELSFGSKTKLSLVMALSRNPEVLLLDEPTVGLDPVARKFLYADLLARMQDGTRTIVIATHQLSELERFADSVALIDRGRLRLQGDMAAITDRFTQADVAAAGLGATMDGVTVLARAGGRVRLLIDRDVAGDAWRRTCGGAVLAEAKLTLEELFVALEAPGTTTLEAPGTTTLEAPGTTALDAAGSARPGARQAAKQVQP